MGVNVPIEELRIVPANESTAADLQALFNEGGDARGCQCQWFRGSAAEYRAIPPAERITRFNEQAHFGDSGTDTSGLVAYLRDEPVGWCAVAPRTEYVRLRNSRLVWSGRDEDRDDDRVWTVSCFVTRKSYRRRGISYALAEAAIDFARQRGASAVEGYPLIIEPKKSAGWAELYVGSSKVFAAAGFREISRPTERRVVMRIDLDQPEFE
ncbi:MAG TPA: GNAT family N-acetyltransferase [Mycobacteriales bacterium]|nr:GNAT family N-acetyltransferase [Mycobacteriales bacterium]